MGTHHAHGQGMGRTQYMNSASIGAVDQPTANMTLEQTVACIRRLREIRLNLLEGEAIALARIAEADAHHKRERIAEIRNIEIVE